jgi:hypothetical protein
MQRNFLSLVSENIFKCLETIKSSDNHALDSSDATRYRPPEQEYGSGKNKSKHKSGKVVWGIASKHPEIRAKAPGSTRGLAIPKFVRDRYLPNLNLRPWIPDVGVDFISYSLCQPTTFP